MEHCNNKPAADRFKRKKRAADYTQNLICHSNIYILLYKKFYINMKLNYNIDLAKNEGASTSQAICTSAKPMILV
jgi:hypothetical protein